MPTAIGIGMTGSMNTTVRDHVRAIQLEILKGNLTPLRTAELNDQAAALIGNANDALIEAEMLYNQQLQSCYRREKTANRAEVEAKTTRDYMEYQQAKHTQMELLELCRSLRKSLDVLREEMRFTPR